MAKSIKSFSWKNGFREAGEGRPWATEDRNGYGNGDANGYEHVNGNGAVKEQSHYVTPPFVEPLTSTVHNDFGLNTLRTWPTMYNGTSSPHGLPEWWDPSGEVDVLICGAGPSGLEVALSLIRQGVSFRIVDKAATPLIAGRGDGVQPRFLETLHSWGLADEVHEEGPLINHTAIYKDGKRLLFKQSHQSESRYRGLHIITQGQIERIYVRDLLRHKKLVERETTVIKFSVAPEDSGEQYPVQAALRNERTGAEEIVRAKFLIGSDGAASTIRKQLEIPFDGVSTDLYWGILDCVFESDYPHAWVFGSVISSEHGGCVIIPREDGYIRLYVQLDVSTAGEVAKSRQAKESSLAESGGRVDTSSITADEVLAQANRIFSPYELKFAAPLSWFAIWKISERVARRFSSSNNRVHLVGDAAHVHSVMGAFGLNASIMDSANVAWKIGLCARNLAQLSTLGPTYDQERRLHANCIIRVSGSYLRFICNSEFPLASFDKATSNLTNLPDAIPYTPGKDLEFIREFFGKNSNFLLGVDAPYQSSIINQPARPGPPAISPRNGVRAPNPRLCFSPSNTGYLYDALLGADMIHLVIFASDLQGPVAEALAKVSAMFSSPDSFYQKYGGKSRFNPILITKCLEFEAAPLLASSSFTGLTDNCRILYDDRAPDEDAHTCYEVDHARGAIVVVRPDLWVGESAFLDESKEVLDKYFGGWLLPVSKE